LKEKAKKADIGKIDIGGALSILPDALMAISAHSLLRLGRNMSKTIVSDRGGKKKSVDMVE
jgi:hypothetical protein